jgi:hypothetical protein
MWFRKKKMPDAMLMRYGPCVERGKASVYNRELIYTFQRHGKRWCTWRAQPLLLRDDGSVVGDVESDATWEFI